MQKILCRRSRIVGDLVLNCRRLVLGHRLLEIKCRGLSSRLSSWHRKQLSSIKLSSIRLLQLILIILIIILITLTITIMIISLLPVESIVILIITITIIVFPPLIPLKKHKHKLKWKSVKIFRKIHFQTYNKSIDLFI